MIFEFWKYVQQNCALKLTELTGKTGLGQVTRQLCTITIKILKRTIIILLEAFTMKKNTSNSKCIKNTKVYLKFYNNSNIEWWRIYPAEFGEEQKAQIWKRSTFQGFQLGRTSGPRKGCGVRGARECCRGPPCLLPSAAFVYLGSSGAYLAAVNIRNLGTSCRKHCNFFVIPVSFPSWLLAYELICIIGTECTFSNRDGFWKHNAGKKM